MISSSLSARILVNLNKSFAIPNWLIAKKVTLFNFNDEVSSVSIDLINLSMVQHSMILQLYCLQSQMDEQRKLTNLVQSTRNQQKSKKNHFQISKRKNLQRKAAPPQLPNQPANQLAAMIMLHWPCGK